MKTTIIIVFMILCFALNGLAYDIKPGRATIYLNNGNIVTGTITGSSHGNNVEIITDSGISYTYTIPEIRHIELNATPIIPQNSNLTPVEGYYSNPYDKDTGMWWSVESTTGYSIRIDKSNGGFEEISVTGGWRFNEYCRVGLGIGGRYYFNCDNFRCHSHQWSMPIYLNVRGGFMPHAERTVTPFYSFDFGAALGDGLLIRPTIGLKIGDMRRAYLIGVSYLGQQMRTWRNDSKIEQSSNTFPSFVALKLGYEF